MDFKVNTVNFSADEKLIAYIKEKVKKLEIIFDHIIASEVYLRVDKNESKENKIVEIKILLPGNELFAKKQCKSFEEATELVVTALKKQIEKHKNKNA